MSGPTKRILVTGAAGFIGSHVAELLVQRGHHVIGMDNFLTGRRDNFPCTFWDVSHSVAVPSDWHRLDLVIHCAASYSDPSDWKRDIRTNVGGAEWVCRLRPKRILYFQTALCYGHDPYSGQAPWPLRLGVPLDPDNSYAISKTAGESYIRHSGIPYVSLRLANIYGPRNLSGPIPTFYKRLSLGQQCTVTNSRRDFVFIDDLLEVVEPIVEGAGEGIYHLASGRDYAISDALEAVLDAMQLEETEQNVRHVPRPDGDSPSILLDPSRAQTEFGWRPRTTLEAGVSRAVRWYMENGVQRTFTHLTFAG